MKIIFISLIGVFLAAGVSAVAPTPINNLSCSFSEEPGTVYLNWTPSAQTASYDVRYFYAMIDVNNFDTVYKFNQSWTGSTNKGLIYPLTVDQNWYFAMKAISSSGEVSEISNIIKCYISTSTVLQSAPVTIPVSSITNPQNGAQVSVAGNYVVFGESYDIGGSSIQKVEISLDGGNNWNLTTPKIAIGTGFTFEYIWQNPAPGNYNIKTRAIDWVNAVETPGSGINVTVLTQQATSTPPINQNTIQELQQKITQLQQQVIQLLNQLISVLRQQLGI